MSLKFMALECFAEGANTHEIALDSQSGSMAPGRGRSNW